MRLNHLLSLSLFLSFAPFVSAMTESFVCQAIDKNQLKSQLRILFEDERLKSFLYQNDILRNDDLDGPSCTVIAERGDQWTKWHDKKETTVVSFAEREHFGRSVTPKIVVVNSLHSVKISMDLVAAHAAFCGAGAAYASSIRYDKRSKKCRFD